MRSKPLEVGITGGIGSGKSLVCKIFSLLQVPVYYADDRAKWITNFDAKVREAVVDTFGEDSYDEHGLNRNYIAKKVFNNAEQLAMLNGIVHPAVGNDYDRWVKEHDTSPYLLKEAALIFESGSYKRLDRVINVTAPEDIRIRRVLQRDPFRSEAEIRSIIERQLPESERQQRSDYIIHNDDQQMVIPQILSLHEMLVSITL